MNIKIERIQSALEREIGSILMLEVQNKNLKFVTITGVKLASDLSLAKVYITVLNDNLKNEIMKQLKQAKGFIRHELTHRIDIRHIPDLEFIYDDSIEYGKRIEDLIEDIHKEDSN